MQIHMQIQLGSMADWWIKLKAVLDPSLGNDYHKSFIKPFPLKWAPPPLNVFEINKPHGGVKEDLW